MKAYSKKAIYFVLILFAPYLSAQASTDFIRVPANQGPELLARYADDPDFTILDVRTPQEFSQGHIEGAVQMNFYESDFVDQLASLDPTKPVLVYCRSGNRSSATADYLVGQGFQRVYNLEGGMLRLDPQMPLVLPR